LQYAGLLDAGTALIESGFTVVTNTTKHSAPMANVVRLKMSFISAPIHFSLRAEPAHQQPVPLPILMPPDFRDRHLRDRNERLPLATAIAAAWLCVVARPWHGATRQPGWLVARVPLADWRFGNIRFSSTGAETLMIASYGIITGVDNTVTAVVARRRIFLFSERGD
jgi:hypothetical protein